MATIFISHSSRDNTAAETMKRWLGSQGFDKTFLDFDKHGGIPPGADWERTLYRKVERSAAMVVILTSNWFDSKWCFVEFAQARALGKPIFPVIHKPSGEMLLSPDIQHLDLRSGQEGLDRLASELTKIALASQRDFDWDKSRPPYPGFLSFDKDDAAIFFGRDDEVRCLIERLNARRAQGGIRLVALLGASGSGKSSLLRAGVVAMLGKDRDHWIVLPIVRPQKQPVEALALALASAAGRGTEWQQMADELAGADRATCLTKLAYDLRARACANRAEILLPIDQGEELFGVAESGEAAYLLEILSEMLGGAYPFVAVVALRSEFLPKLQTSASLTARFEEYSLKPMPLERVGQIIEGPAKVADLKIDRGLVTAMTQDAGTEDALPLLAFALRELWDKHHETKELTLNNYRDLGGSDGDLTPLERIVRRVADQVLEDAKAMEQELKALRAAFIPGLVRVSYEGEYVRQSALRKDLPADSQRLVKALEDARLLVNGGEGGEALVEVAHEALLRKWPLLRRWLDDQREFLIGKQQLEVDVAEWHKAKKAENASDADIEKTHLRGLKLSRAKVWLEEPGKSLTDQEREFIADSAESDAREQQARERFRQIILLGSIGFAVVVGILSVWLFLSQQVSADRLVEARHNLGKSFVAGAQEALRAGRPTAAFLMAARASGAPDVAPAGEADRKTLLLPGSPEMARANSLVRLAGPAAVWPVARFRHSARLYSVARHPTEDEVAVGTYDGKVLVFDSALAAPQRVLQLHGREIVHDLEFSPDGALLATGGLDSRVVVTGLRDSSSTELSFGAQVLEVEFSPDGANLAVAGTKHEVALYDLGNDYRETTLDGRNTWVVAVAFHPTKPLVYLAGQEGRVLIHDLQTSAEVEIQGHDALIHDLEVSPDGSRFATAAHDGKLKLWDAETHQLLREFQFNSAKLIDLEFNRDGSRILVSGWDNTTRIWNAETGALEATIDGHDGWAQDVLWLTGDDRILTASLDGMLRLWDVSTLRPLLPGIRAHPTGDVLRGAYSPDGRIFVSVGEDGRAAVHRMVEGRPVEDADFEILHDNQMLALSLSADGRWLAVCSRDRRISIAQLERREVTRKIGTSDALINDLAIFPEERSLFGAGEDGILYVWDMDSGETKHKVRVHQGGANRLYLRPQDRRLFSAGADGRLIEWDMDSLEPVSTVAAHADDITGIEMTRDGALLLTVSYDGKIATFDGESLEEVAGRPRIEVEQQYPEGVVVDDAARYVATSGEDTLMVWKLDGGEEVQWLGVNVGPRGVVGFVPGSHVLTFDGGGGFLRFLDLDLKGPMDVRPEYFRFEGLSVRFSDGR